ncbi:MAG: PD-(D/E)XK nuclease family protein [Bacillota bacterium]
MCETKEKNAAGLAVLEKLIEEIHACEKETMSKQKTFLEVIGRSNYENFVSRLFLYTLERDINLLKYLIEKYAEDKKKGWIIGDIDSENIFTRVEKPMGSGRCDIFIEATDSNGKKIVVAIENKINASEHGEQTMIYHEWVEKNYNSDEYNNVYVFLKPDYNPSQPSCDEFMSVTYKEVGKEIADSDDMIVKDFKTHIKQYQYEEVKMNTVENYYFENFNVIEETRKQVFEKIEGLKQELAKKIKNELVDDKELIQDTDNLVYYKEHFGGVFGRDKHAFYKKGGEWYKDRQYYFYVEIDFVTPDLSEIVCRQMVKTYGDSSQSDIATFLIVNNYGDGKNKYCELDRSDKIETIKDIGSEEWQKEIVKASSEILKGYIVANQKLFDEFQCHLQGK